MRYVDAFCHFFPDALWQRMLKLEGAAAGIGARMRGVPCIYDLDERFRVMDLFKHHDYTQVISLGMPPLEQLGTPEPGERAIDVQVTRLRRKLEPDPREPRFIQTVRHRGYVLRPGL